LQGGIYDPVRNVYYFADQSKVQVLSLSGGWQTPIALPAVGANTRLLGLSLSADGSKLAVSDFGDKTIYVLDPDTPASAQSFALPQAGADMGSAPCGITILNSGIVYFASADTDGTGDWAFHKLNTNTATFSDVSQLQDGGSNDEFIRVLSNPDESVVYSQIDGVVFSLNTSNDVLTFATGLYSNSGGNNELALSADGSALATNGFFADANLNAIGLQVYTDRETWLAVGTIGQKFNKDGSVFFQPLTNGIDVIDTQTGRLVNRVQFALQLPTVYDALVVDGRDDVVAIITTNGVVTIDLTSVAPSSAVRARANATAVSSRSMVRPAPPRATSLRANSDFSRRPHLNTNVEAPLK
jgi:hypothetical protein